jgi:hypothetical protein
MDTIVFTLNAVCFLVLYQNRIDIFSKIYAFFFKIQRLKSHENNWKRNSQLEGEYATRISDINNAGVSQMEDEGGWNQTYYPNEGEGGEDVSSNLHRASEKENKWKNIPKIFEGSESTQVICFNSISFYLAFHLFLARTKSKSLMLKYMRKMTDKN